MIEDYKGYKSIEVNAEELAALYEGTYIPEGLRANEYLIPTTKGEVVDIFRYDGTKLKRKINYPTLGDSFTGIIKPRNHLQTCAMDIILNKDIPVKLITGKFGTGKSLLCIVGALAAVNRGEFDKIIFVRNNVQVKDTDPLGALPGSEYDKTLPYLMPFADHCGGVDGVNMLVAQGKLEVIPLGFLRGRSIKNSIIYSMESENLTKEHIQLIMGRVDDGSQLWLDGDIKQRDKAAFEKSKGLERMVEALSGNPLFGHIHLERSERSEVARLCDLLD